MLLRTAIVGVALGLGLLGAAQPASAGGPPEKGDDAAKSAKPPVFSSLTFDEALAKTKGDAGQGKVAVVKFTAEWCGPCKMMDRTTWRDPKVEAWVKDHGWAIQVDVDEQRDTAQAQRVRAMPTMIVYKNGEPVGRRVGAMDAPALLRFLDESLADKPAVAPDPAGEAAARDKMGMHERLVGARQLVEDGKADKAIDEYLWLWKHMTEREPAMVGVRSSFMAADMQLLAEEHAPAKAAFAKERDALEARLKTDARSYDDLLDWIVLNRVVADQDRTLAWFDRVKRDPDLGPTFQRAGYLVDRLLEERGRWADLALLTPDPMRELRIAQAVLAMPMPAGADPALRRQAQETAARMHREKAAVLYVSMLAGGREDDAGKVLEAAVKADDTPDMRVALVAKAAEARTFRKRQLSLLDEAEAKGTDVQELRGRIQSGLAAVGG